MSKDCIFCQIINKQAPAKIVYEDEQLVAFPDIQPKAPVHLIIVPKKHLESLNQAENSDSVILGQLFLAAKKLAQEYHLADSGYKLAMNVGRGGGQLVNHLHLHLLGGRELRGIV